MLEIKNVVEINSVKVEVQMKLQNISEKDKKMENNRNEKIRKLDRYRRPNIQVEFLEESTEIIER